MTVEVTPTTFTYVYFDSAYIARIAQRLIGLFHLENHNIRIDINETTPLAKMHIEFGDPIVINIQSGAFEDFSRPRQQSEPATTQSLGRILLKVRDRLSPEFANAPADEDLTLVQVAIWETYCVARLSRHDIDINRQRWLYNFRNRHGFNDASDRAFEKIWNSNDLTWEQLQSISDTAIALVQ